MYIAKRISESSNTLRGKHENMHFLLLIIFSLSEDIGLFLLTWEYIEILNSDYIKIIHIY
jgi:hypothetical protein